MRNEWLAGFLAACISLGMLGAALGAWVFSRAVRAQVQAQRWAFEQARKQAQRDLQQTLLCVPQWVQQTVRLELELLGRQQAERDRTRSCEQQHWQSAQDARRQAEWRTLLSGLGNSGASQAAAHPVVTRTGGSAPVPSADATFLPESSSGARKPPVVTVATQETPDRELTDAEIDALPPDLPPPVQAQSRKIAARNKTILRNI